MKLKHFEKTVVGLVRKANEDSIGSLTIDKTNGYGEVFVVCDGMGGHVGGAIASKTAVDCILQYFEGSPNSNPIIALEKSISFANMQIYAKAVHDDSLKGMGTTCTVLLNKGDNIYIAHVGDSRIYINTDNKLYRLTKDHSFVQSLVDAGQLKDSEMEDHPRKNELTRALGISQDVDVEIAENPISSKTGDTFLMCSDGLCGLVNDATIANTMKTTVEDKTVNDLIKLAENAGGNDNISVTIINVVESPHKTTIFKNQANISFDLSATQVLDVSSMKLDKKNNSTTRYRKYVLGSILMIILFIGIIKYPQFNIFSTQDDTNISDTTKTQDTIKVKEIIDKKTDSDQIEETGTLFPTKKVQKTSSKKNKQVEKIKNISKKKSEADRVSKEIELEREISVTKILKEIKKIFKGQDSHKDSKEFTDLSKIETDLKEKVSDKKWNEIDSLKEIAKKNIIAFQLVISIKKDKSEQQINKNDEESNDIKSPKTGREEILSNGYVEKKYKWDIKDCSAIKELSGEVSFYHYSDEQKAVNILFEEEETKKRNYIKKGYRLKLKINKDSLPGELKIIYDNLKGSEKLLEELKRCSGDKYGSKEYYFKE